MKIAMLGPSFPFKGGIPEYTTSLFRVLNRKHDVLFCSFKRQYPVWLYPGKSDRDQSARLLYEPSAEPLFDSLNPFSWRHTAKRIALFEPSVLILPWWVFFLGPQFYLTITMLRRRQPGVRTVFVCHNVTPHEDNWFAPWVSRKVLALGDGFLVHSNTDRSELKNMFSNASIEMAEHPVYELEHEPPGNKSDARRKLNLKGNTLLFFGFVRPYKGLDVLLEAMPAVLGKIDCTLLIAGEFWQKSEVYMKTIVKLGLESKVRIDDRYIPKQDVSNYFLASDLILLPYLSATGSGIEKLAYSFGRPVVVSDVGSLPQSVEEGVNGYIVPPGDPKALAGAIIDHFECNNQQAMEIASAQIGQKFSWNNLTTHLEKLFE